MLRILLIALLFLSQIYNLRANDPEKELQTQIQKNLKEAKTRDNKAFSSGTLLINSDSVKCKIYVKKQGNFDKTMYSFVIAKLSNDSLIAYTADQVSGFIVNGHHFRRHCSEIEGKTRCFFIHQVISGYISLYERDGFILDRAFRYYAHFQKAEYFITIDPFTQNLFNETDLGGKIVDLGGPGVFNVRTKKVDEKFKMYFSNLLKDCPVIKNKILNEFYTINDLETIILEYNRCR
ncbi:MAG TPA: hypothetical protein VHO72_07935 [Bacteroidales bacterium]|nr:hypothetical protein [Bacteroidales bacterium]